MPSPGEPKPLEQNERQPSDESFEVRCEITGDPVSEPTIEDRIRDESFGKHRRESAHCYEVTLLLSREEIRTIIAMKDIFRKKSMTEAVSQMIDKYKPFLKRQRFALAVAVKAARSGDVGPFQRLCEKGILDADMAIEAFMGDGYEDLLTAADAEQQLRDALYEERKRRYAEKTFARRARLQARRAKKANPGSYSPPEYSGTDRGAGGGFFQSPQMARIPIHGFLGRIGRGLLGPKSDTAGGRSDATRREPADGEPEKP